MAYSLPLPQAEQARRQVMLLRLQIASDDPRLTPELRARVEQGARHLRRLLRRSSR